MLSWLLLFAGLCGCGLQAGRFCTSGEESLNSSSHVGCLSIVHGSAIENGRSTGDRENLLFFMIICSGVQLGPNYTEGSGIEGDTMSRPIIYHDWEDQATKVHVEVHWDTRSDIISVGKQEFSRDKGNVLVITRKPNGDLTGQQCGTLGTNVDFPEVAAQIRKQLPNDELVRSVKFFRIDN